MSNGARSLVEATTPGPAPPMQGRPGRRDGYGTGLNPPIIIRSLRVAVGATAANCLIVGS